MDENTETTAEAAVPDAPIGTWFWHIHHETLAEALYEPLSARIDYIQRMKPEDEQETRLRWLTPIENMPADVVAAQAAFLAATETLSALVSARDNGHYFDEGEAEARNVARKAAQDARFALSEATNHMSPTLEELHAAQHPGCPWDGRTIFPDEPESGA